MPLFSKLTEPAVVASSRVNAREQREEAKRRGLLNARTNSTEARKRRGFFPSPRPNVSDTTNTGVVSHDSSRVARRTIYGGTTVSLSRSIEGFFTSSYLKVREDKEAERRFWERSLKLSRA
ncbi:hypothetical protein K0M31_003633, partial [Melipona bicolor]